MNDLLVILVSSVSRHSSAPIPLGLGSSLNSPASKGSENKFKMQQNRNIPNQPVVSM